MKNTKKSMFITTVLMVAVLIVAVSTATFAWYTANDAATASTATIGAASSTDANIAVGWTDQGRETTISFADSDVSLQPMVPSADYMASDTDVAFADFAFDSANIDADGDFGTLTHPTAWVVKKNAVGTEGQEGYQAAASSFHVINYNVNSGARVRMTADIPTADIANMVNIAVFINGNLEAVLNKQGVVYKVGPIGGTDGATNEGDLNNSAAAAINAATGFTFDLGKAGSATDSVEITIKAWLDGDLLESPNAGKNATFSFTFRAEQTLAA